MSFRCLIPVTPGGRFCWEPASVFSLNHGFLICPAHALELDVETDEEIAADAMECDYVEVSCMECMGLGCISCGHAGSVRIGRDEHRAKLQRFVDEIKGRR